VLDRVEFGEPFAVPLAVPVGLDLLTERIFSVVAATRPSRKPE
jgi:hypothetical protein